MCQTQSSTDLSFNSWFQVYSPHLSNLSPDLSSMLLTSIHHYPQGISITWLSHRLLQLNALKLNLPSLRPHLLLLLFPSQGKGNPQFPKPETQGLSLTRLFPSPALSHQALLISLHGCLLFPLPSLLSWFPGSGFNSSFPRHSSYRSLGLSSQSIQSIHHTASRITFLIVLLVKVTFQRLSISCRVKVQNP